MHDYKQPDKWCVMGACYEAGLTTKQRNKLFSQISKNVDIGDSTGIVAWQDSFPYNRESKDYIVKTVRQAEIDIGLRNESSTPA